MAFTALQCRLKHLEQLLPLALPFSTCLSSGLPHRRQQQEQKQQLILYIDASRDSLGHSSNSSSQLVLSTQSSLSRIRIVLSVSVLPSGALESVWWPVFSFPLLSFAIVVVKRSTLFNSLPIWCCLSVSFSVNISSINSPHRHNSLTESTVTAFTFCCTFNLPLFLFSHIPVIPVRRQGPECEVKIQVETVLLIEVP